jgi:ankyrin repeat protein
MCLYICVYQVDWLMAKCSRVLLFFLKKTLISCTFLIIIYPFDISFLQYSSFSASASPAPHFIYLYKNLLPTTHNKEQMTFSQSPIPPKNLLHYFVKQGDLEIVRALVSSEKEQEQQHKMLNAKNENHTTPVQLAVELGDTDMVAFFLESNKELIHAKDDETGASLLHRVCGKKDGNAMAALLLSYGADLNAIDYSSKTPLHKFAECRETELVSFVLLHYQKMLSELSQADCNIQLAHLVDMPDIAGMTSLHYAAISATNGDTTIIQMLIDAGADVNSATSGRTPLLDVWDYETFLLLLSHGADLNVTSVAGGETVLMHAATLLSDGIPMVKYCLQQKVNLNAQDIQGNTALHHAVHSGYFPIIGMLLVAGADRSIKNGQGQCALDVAQTYYSYGERIQKTFIMFLLGRDISCVQNVLNTLECSNVAKDEVIKSILPLQQQQQQEQQRLFVTTVLDDIVKNDLVTFLGRIAAIH